jgi:hypothetical protein
MATMARPSIRGQVPNRLNALGDDASDADGVHHQGGVDGTPKNMHQPASAHRPTGVP